MRDFVNTIDLESGEEALPDTDALRAWLADRGLGSGSTVRQADRERALRFREALRRLLLANTGQPLDEGAARELHSAAARSGLRASVDGDGRVALVPAGAGVDGLIARLLQTVAHAQAEGTWERMKACPAEPCGWAFYDESRNRSRSWCSMGVCGNRVKTRRYRRRKKGDDAG
jgi:predicted RNA-binding Zn ribbon-like protein